MLYRANLEPFPRHKFVGIVLHSVDKYYSKWIQLKVKKWILSNCNDLSTKVIHIMKMIHFATIWTSPITLWRILRLVLRAKF